MHSTFVSVAVPYSSVPQMNSVLYPLLLQYLHQATEIFVTSSATHDGVDHIDHWHKGIHTYRYKHEQESALPRITVCGKHASYDVA